MKIETIGIAVVVLSYIIFNDRNTILHKKNEMFFGLASILIFFLTSCNTSIKINGKDNDIIDNLQFDIKDSSKCSKLQWTKSGPRSQGGGWVWFSGQGIGNSLYESYKNSEFLAIDRLNKECKYPHYNIRFVERCDDSWGDKYISFVRASVTLDECNLTKTIDNSSSSVVNQNVYRDYLSTLFIKTTSDEFCNEASSEKCIELGEQYYLENNIHKAFENYSIGCKSGIGLSCFYAGSAAIQGHS